VTGRNLTEAGRGLIGRAHDPSRDQLHRPPPP